MNTAETPHTEPVGATIQPWWATILRLAIVGAALAGILIQVLEADPSRRFGSFVYFTTQSNFLLAAVFIAILCRPNWWDGLRGPQARAAVVLWICITGIVYHTLLTGPLAMGGSGATAETIESILLHKVTPILAFADWFLVGSGQRLVRWRTSLFWLVYPLSYLAFSLVRGLFVDKYPYPFVDVNKLGYSGVAIAAVGLFFAFWSLGLAVIALGKWGARLRRK